MNPPEEPQQKSSRDHHTPPQTPPPEQGKLPGTDHRVIRLELQLACWQGKADFTPFPNDHIVVVDDENSVEQVRQSDALEEGHIAERDNFIHILTFFFYIIVVCVEERLMLPFTWYRPADLRGCPVAKRTGREMKVLTEM